MERKIALVTGSNRGIGFATVKGLLEKNYTVILTARSESSGKQAMDKLSSLGDLHFHSLDVANEASVAAIQQFVEREFGRLDILINNAGMRLIGTVAKK